MRNKTIRQMTLDALFIAIIGLMVVFPQVGMITIGPFASLTLIPIPVLIGARLLNWQRGLVYGLAFGIGSWILALTRAVTPTDILFQNPLTSILPRAIFGLVAGLAYALLKTIKKPSIRMALEPFFAFVLTFFHGAITLTMLCVFEPDWWPFLVPILTTNTIIEGVITFVVVPIVTLSLLRIPRITQYVSEINEKKE